MKLESPSCECPEWDGDSLMLSTVSGAVRTRRHRPTDPQGNTVPPDKKTSSAQAAPQNRRVRPLEHISVKSHTHRHTQPALQNKMRMLPYVFALTQFQI